MDREEFIRRLDDSGLHSTANHVRDSSCGYGKTIAADLLADELVRENRLTTFQAAKLLNGDTQDLAFGGYTILDKVGQGGMGVVFKARRSGPYTA